MTNCSRFDWSRPRICPACGALVHEHLIDKAYGDAPLTYAHCHRCGYHPSLVEFGQLPVWKEEHEPGSEVQRNR